MELRTQNLFSENSYIRINPVTSTTDLFYSILRVFYHLTSTIMKNLVPIYKLVLILGTLGPISFCGCEKILFFFAGGSYSHKHSVWPWTMELAERGHDVTFLSGYDKSPSDSPHPKLRDLSSPTLHSLMSKSYDIDRFQQRERGEEQTILTEYSLISVDICETILLHSQNDPVLQGLIHNETFDLVVINIIFGECGFAFAHQYGAKTIVYDASVTLAWFYDIYGFQPESSWIPDVIIKYKNIPMSFYERMKNAVWPAYRFWDRYTVMYPELDRIMRTAFRDQGDIPLFAEMEKNASLIIVNSHHSFDFAYSLPPCVVQIGGINAYLPEKEIPEKYKNFMDGAGSDGVVLISFGSTVRLEKVAVYYSRIFFEVIKKHKNTRFILKWSGPVPKDFESEGFENLLTSDWLPQRELLRHPKLRAFVTHGGLNSIQEATFYGVPMIVLPLFADQDYNAYRIEAQQVGFRLEIRDLTFQLMDEALSKILGDPQYKKNMEVKSRIFRDRPQSPLEQAVFWTEFILRNDDVTALKPMNSHLNWYQRRLLDVYITYGILLLFIILLCGLLFFKLVQWIFTRKEIVRFHDSLISSRKDRVGIVGSNSRKIKNS